MSPTATASSGRGLLIHGGPTPVWLAASTSTATPTPTPASVRTGGAVRTVLSILGVCIPTSQEPCPHRRSPASAHSGALRYRTRRTGLPPGDDRTPAGSATKHHHQPTRAARTAATIRPGQAQASATSQEGPIVTVAQQAGTTPRQTEGTPAARLARWALRAVITVTALGVALAACSNTSDPVGTVGSSPATGPAAKIQAADGNHFTPKTLNLPAGKQVTIQITNSDDTAHDFAIEAAG